MAAAVRTRRPLYQSLGAIPGVEVLEWRPARTWMVGRSVRPPGHPSREQAAGGRWPRISSMPTGSSTSTTCGSPRLFRCPVVVSPHGACHPVVLAKSRRLAKRAFLGTERVLLRHHRRAYHALSPAEADHVAAVFPDTPTYCVPQGPSTFVTAGVFPGGFVPSPSPQGVTFVFVGRLDVFTKGLDLLLEAFASTVHEAPGQSSRLILAGAGLERRAELAPATGDRARDRGQGALHGSASRRGGCRGGARERGHLRAAFAARGLSPKRRGSAAGAQAGRPQPSDRHDVVPGNRGAAPRPCGTAERRRGHPGDDGAGRSPRHDRGRPNARQRRSPISSAGIVSLASTWLSTSDFGALDRRPASALQRGLVGQQELSDRSLPAELVARTRSAPSRPIRSRASGSSSSATSASPKSAAQLRAT